MKDPVDLFIKFSSMKKKEYAKALDEFNELLNKYPDKAAVLFQIGNVHSIIGRNPKKAIDVYNKVLKLNPKFCSALFNRANCHKKLKKYRLAIKDYTRLLKFEENDLVYEERGRCYFAMKQYRKAAADLLMALENLNYQIEEATKSNRKRRR